ncbi:hypothetical protein PP614_16545 [Mycobacteroides abscessus]|uniref:hypothetical protein n=1 Tax=Mycobacteroides abscessus TaxID=36809 RepID=UPI00078EB611|nr:hypothetical protein [Mycobacteroides abscessus]QSM04146.1 hypothetical protein PROPHIGD51-2_8 [Mycobacterium phage prophiGD51-2]AMU55740.1 hypothetical protein A3O02_11600 [Mycobacteroides abscessus]MBE5436508.1 hypothetical protein [Mycobacteroides abscessus]MBN7447593.1 hypothetical protein [Mycobacteroides abscessus subsp. abscessus]MDM1901667.1 hypothetical protein [Mycobacteroides abscessus]
MNAGLHLATNDWVDAHPWWSDHESRSAVRQLAGWWACARNDAEPLGDRSGPALERMITAVEKGKDDPYWTLLHLRENAERIGPELFLLLQDLEEDWPEIVTAAWFWEAVMAPEA